MTRIATTLVIVLLAAASPREAKALIRGDAGNKPLHDPGWPTGAAGIFNHPSRVAWWEGPPFGGGQWHSECRGDANALNAVLAEFARVDAKTRRVVVHDGVGYSFWLAPNGEPQKRVKVDWVLMVWQATNWERLHEMPADLNPTEPDDDTPPAQLDVFTDEIRWSDVVVPDGLTVVDQRLEAHGFTAADGRVLEGKVAELSSGRPIAATVRLERVEPQEKGGYAYPLAVEATTDAQGHWVMRRSPAGWHRVVVSAEGFVPRVAGYVQADEQPRWQPFDCGLAAAASVSGRIVDEAGGPLAGVEVRLDNVQPKSGGRYESSREYRCTTDADGRFRAEPVPEGTASVWLFKPGYCRPGLGLSITSPAEDVALTMMKASGVRVTVDFGGAARPGGYMVKIEPEGGEAEGSFGGVGDVDARNQLAFEIVPPGRYVIWGQPNPGSSDERSERITVELKGGETAEATLKAK
ncbi:carboxypeptidase-like regulatory domain-containing protein [Paludisphaera mucosa]|uniref:Carboxypeptidase-like regulatory domain-containing protein n=1 Tax=Paludisphaera mucosa TaxID=3030827 RepID=A0ABT6FF32_9BACT|nr:carboxypeptidase-like regulatory domain-containing protein [Paludisphaera mucosa]MDG3006183.1 carboxypeptidase-like regulatory domain-containing protein [Paludisphaera mucosa]